MTTGVLLLLGIAIFALALGAVGCYIASVSEHAERRQREEFERRRMAREPWYADGLDGRTPTL